MTGAGEARALRHPRAGAGARASAAAPARARAPAATARPGAAAGQPARGSSSVVKLPRGPKNGFDERPSSGATASTSCCRPTAGASSAGAAASAGSPTGCARGSARAGARALRGERRALVAGVVLGDDQGLSRGARATTSGPRASTTCWPSAGRTSCSSPAAVVAALPGCSGSRAGSGSSRRSPRSAATCSRSAGSRRSSGPASAGALGSLAWLAARPRDRWYFLLLGAAVLLAWNPYTLLDPGFQLSFAAVAAIFVARRRALQRRLEGYPLPAACAMPLAVSLACGVATAPILWLQFGAVPLLSVLANALAAPGDRAPARARLASAARRAGLAPGARASLAQAERLVRRLLAGCAPARRRPCRSPLVALGCAAFSACSHGRRRLPRAYALPRWRDLQPVYLLAGTDRPKIVPGAAPAAGAGSARRPSSTSTRQRRAARMRSPPATRSGSSAAAAGWSSSRAWSGGRRPTGRRSAATSKSPTPETVLALVGNELKADSPLVKAVAKAGEVLALGRAEARPPGLGGEQFARLGAQADRDACRTLVELVGDNLQELASEVEKIATWAGGEPIGAERRRAARRRRARRRRRSRSPTRGARRDVGAVLAACESLLEHARPSPTPSSRSSPPRRPRPRAASGSTPRASRRGTPPGAEDAPVRRGEGVRPRAQLRPRSCATRPSARRAGRSAQGRQPARRRPRARARARSRSRGRREAPEPPARSARRSRRAGRAARPGPSCAPAVFRWIAPLRGGAVDPADELAVLRLDASASPSSTALSSRRW